MLGKSNKSAVQPFYFESLRRSFLYAILIIFHIAVSTISNSAFSDVAKIVKPILKDYFNDQAIAISEDEIKQFVGSYHSVEDDNDIIEFKNDKNTLIHIVKGVYKSPLIYKGNHTFLFDQTYATSIVFEFSEDGKKVKFLQGDYKGEFVKK